MKRKIIIILSIFSILFLPSKKQAQTITQSPQLTITPASNIDKNINALLELMKIMFWEGKINTFKNFNKSDNYQNSNQNTNNFVNIQITPDINGYIYYPQCNGPYDQYPLPQGGTLCKAGCGPTTVAMITASFVSKDINPKTIVNKYQTYGYYLGPKGSRYSDAQNILKSYNLKIATIFADNRLKTIDQLMNQFGSIIKNYQQSGWTFFALANFCDEGCGHYFWIIKIDDGLNTWAYDPYYGRLLPRPYNEKSRYPFPKYRGIFGVKK